MIHPYLTITVIDSLRALQALRPDWQRLAAISAEACPFSPGSGTLRGGSTYAPSAGSSRTRCSSTWSVTTRRSAIAPFMLTSRPAHRLGVRTVDFIGADPNITEVRRVLCDPDADRRLRRTDDTPSPTERRLGPHSLAGDRSREDAESILGNQTDVQFEASSDVPDFVLPLTNDWDSFRASRPRNVKEALRKCYNSLKRDGHRFDFEVVSRPGEVRDALDDFFSLHRARAQANVTVTHRDVFETAEAQGFLLDVCSRLADEGRLRIFRLRIAGRVVATRIGFVDGSHLYLYYSGYDPAWSKYSVMTTTVAEALQYAIAEGTTSVNLSTAADVSKSRWRPDEIVYRSALQTSDTARGRTLAMAHRCLGAAQPTVAPRARQASFRPMRVDRPQPRAGSDVGRRRHGV